MITKATKRLLLFVSTLVLMPSYEIAGRERNKEHNDNLVQHDHPFCINETKLNA